MIHRVLFVAVVAALTTSSFAQQSGSSWYRGEREKFEVLISGPITMDGQPATEEVDVRIQLKRNKALYWSQTVRSRGGRYEAWVPVGAHPWYSISISSQSSAGAFGSNFTVAGELQKAIYRGLDLKLISATRAIQIKATHQGQPLPHARILVHCDWLELTSQADDEGQATVHVPASAKYIDAMAWTEAKLISPVLYRRAGSDAFLRGEYTLDLVTCKPRKYAVLDAEGEGVAGVQVTITARSSEPVDAPYWPPPGMSVATDAQGQFNYDWLPDVKELTLFCQPDTVAWVAHEVDKSSEPITFKIKKERPRQTIHGVVEAAPGIHVAGLFVKFIASLSIEDSDQAQAIVDPAGNFSIDLIPGATYAAYLDDWQLVSEFQKVAIDPNQSERPRPKLKAIRGTPIQVQVTQGNNSQPQPDARVWVHTPYSLRWAENGKQRNHGVRRYSSVFTDERGKATLYAMPGEANVGVLYDQWNAESRHRVTENDNAPVQFNRRLTSTVRGYVVADGLAIDSLKNTKVALASCDNRLSESQTTFTDSGGKFEVQSAAAALCGLAMTADEQHMGISKLANIHDEFVIKLRPTSSVAGTLVDGRNNPLANVEIEAQVVLSNREALNPVDFIAFKRKTMSDADGKFLLDRLPCQAVIRLVTYELTRGSRQMRYLDSLMLEAQSDKRVGMRMVIGDDRASNKPLTLAEQFKRLMIDCRLNDYRLLVLLADKHTAIDNFLDNRLLAESETPRIGAYMPMRVSTAERNDQSLQLLCEQYKWPNISPEQVTACIYDGHGRELGRATVGTTSEDFNQVVGLVNRHAPAVKSAEEGWKAALAEASKSNRRVWVRLSGKTCGPCKLLTRWMDEHKATLDKEFVMLKVDVGNDTHVDAIADRMQQNRLTGIPFHSIYGADGKLLTDSYGPLGNIGYPGGLEALRHFRQMLETGCLHLQASDIDELVKSLE